MGWFSGSKPKNRQISTLTKEQMPLQNQLVNAGLNPGAGGSFGTSADYYRGLLSDDNEDYNAFARPELRRFNEEIIPDLAEQFAGLGSGGLSSSGFRNAAVNAGSDLSERLGAIRAQLRQQGAQGLMGIGQMGLNPVVENVQTPGTPGVSQFLGQGLGSIGSAIGSPAFGAIGGALGNSVSNWISNKGKTGPY